MPPVKLSRDEFEKRYRSGVIASSVRLWMLLGMRTATREKSPITRKAVPGFADPDYEMSVDWLAAREAILAAHADTTTSARNYVSC
ncbi:hypothetical protein SAMN05443248_4428 [Bradyrhizobium erythrophlei]|jgi:hypothetical protein|uniref:Uncharacterized protein n=1 Tax=Bradyrhizobium erythrophlei TaxID=1437360 RepID=A0A1M5RZX9_9BRAD|nr:hypothetical protein SAMN05443248_4428 [Bradyrhizobium erythrophlei]